MFDLNIIFILILFDASLDFLLDYWVPRWNDNCTCTFFAFKLSGYSSDLLMHLAVGTSLAIIFPTSIMSSYTHYKMEI